MAGNINVEEENVGSVIAIDWGNEQSRSAFHS